MGKNREPKKPVKSQSESEGREEGSEEESIEISEPEPETNVLQSAEKRHKEDSSEDEADSEESDGPDENVKPLASKPMEIGPKKLRSKPNSEPETATKSKALKRSVDDDKETEAKNSKKPKTTRQPEVQTSVKKQQRLWSEEDEIVILNGLIDYTAKKKADPAADMNAFHEFIKKKIHIDATRAQLQDKVRKLRIKYVNNKNKTFTKPHEQELYELSKQIWNDEAKVMANGGTLFSPKKPANNVTVDVEAAKEPKVEKGKGKNGNMRRTLEGNRANVSGTAEESFMRIGVEAFEGGDDVEGAEEWRKLKVQEMEALLNQLDVKRAQVKLVLDFLKSH